MKAVVSIDLDGCSYLSITLLVPEKSWKRQVKISWLDKYGYDTFLEYKGSFHDCILRGIEFTDGTYGIKITQLQHKEEVKP